MDTCKVLSVRCQCGQLQHQGGYDLLTANESPNGNQIQPDKMWEKQ